MAMSTLNIYMNTNNDIIPLEGREMCVFVWLWAWKCGRDAESDMRPLKCVTHLLTINKASKQRAII
jgi:hypothetical protein